MTYIDQNLITGESIQYRARLHWIVMANRILASIVLIGIAAALLYFRLSSTADPTRSNDLAKTLFGWLGLILLAGAVVLLLSAAVIRRSAEFAVTNKRVILKTGFFQNKTEEMFLNKIESVGVDQSAAGRVLGYGTIMIRGTGGSFEPFEHVSRPLEFRRQIQEQVGKSFEKITG